MRTTTKTALIASLALLTVQPATALVTQITETFEFGIDDNGTWMSVGTSPATILFDPIADFDFDIYDRINTQNDPLDGDGIVGNLAGDNEDTGDLLPGDGGLSLDTQNAIVGDEAMGLNVGTMELNEALTLVVDLYNDNASFFGVFIQFYNVTDDVVLASIDSGARGNLQNENEIRSYRPVSATLEYIATADDAGDTLQIRLVEENNNVVRDLYIDSYTLSSMIVDPTDPADLDLDGDVDDADFALFFAAFSGPGVPTGNPAADLDGDNDTDDADFGLAFAAFTGPGAAASVPEPASLAWLGLGGLLVARRRRA